MKQFRSFSIYTGFASVLSRFTVSELAPLTVDRNRQRDRERKG